MTEKKYYLCTLQHHGDNPSAYRTMLMDRHPIEYMAEHNAVLIHHIEITKEQYVAGVVR